VFFVSTYITNLLFLVTVYLSGFQHVQLKRPNPVANIQFVMMAFSLSMMILVALYNYDDPWLSDGFFLTAVGCLALMIRQHRLLPPMQPFE
jgi:hypothetical protein